MAKPGRPQKTKFQSPKGMHDILPKDWAYFQKVFDVCNEMAQWYRFGRIETPILEQAELFTKGVGADTDIVEKQMYVLKVGKGEALALRPEGTAPVVRAYIQNGMSSLSKPVKLWYFSPFFRHEKPQAGRYRQFWQFGFEFLGEKSPVIDAQAIQITLNILRKLKLNNLLLQINSIGCSRCRARYKKILTKFLKSRQRNLCVDCKRRLKQSPFRILDCKDSKCQEIITEGPQVVDYLCKECRFHFKEVLEFLDILEVPYRLNPYLVRGLDYYSKTIFEIFMAKPSDELSCNNIALAGGGRYDGLVRLSGGQDTPGCGMAAGVERIIDLMKQQEFKLRKAKHAQIFLAQLGILSKRKALMLFEEFRKAGIPVYEAFSKDSLRAQLDKANRLRVKYSVILGQKEVLEGKIIIRDMKKGTQKIVKLEKVVEIIKKLI